MHPPSPPHCECADGVLEDLALSSDHRDSIRPRFAPTLRRAIAKPQVDRWGGLDLNQRPTDYESAALTD